MFSSSAAARNGNPNPLMTAAPRARLVDWKIARRATLVLSTVIVWSLSLPDPLEVCSVIGLWRLPCILSFDDDEQGTNPSTFQSSPKKRNNDRTNRNESFIGLQMSVLKDRVGLEIMVVVESKNVKLGTSRV